MTTPATPQYPKYRWLTCAAYATMWLVLTGSLGPVTAHAQIAQIDQQVIARSLVEVRGEDRRGRDFPIAKGFVVSAEGFVVTVGQRSLKGAEKIVIVPLHGDGTAYEVQQPIYHPSSELAVLYAPALRLEPLLLPPLFAPELAPDQAVFVPLQDTWVRGRVDGVVRRPVRAYGDAWHTFVRHNTNVGSESYGAPLLNEFGIVNGVNHPNPDLPARRLVRKTKPDSQAFAIHPGTLREFLISKDVVFEMAQVEQMTWTPNEVHGYCLAHANTPTILPSGGIFSIFLQLYLSDEVPDYYGCLSKHRCLPASEKPVVLEDLRRRWTSEAYKSAKDHYASQGILLPGPEAECKYVDGWCTDEGLAVSCGLGVDALEAKAFAESSPEVGVEGSTGIRTRGDLYTAALRASGGDEGRSSYGRWLTPSGAAFIRMPAVNAAIAAQKDAERKHEERRALARERRARERELAREARERRARERELAREARERRGVERKQTSIWSDIGAIVGATAVATAAAKSGDPADMQTAQTIIRQIATSDVDTSDQQAATRVLAEAAAAKNAANVATDNAGRYLALVVDDRDRAGFGYRRQGYPDAPTLRECNQADSLVPSERPNRLAPHQCFFNNEYAVSSGATKEGAEYAAMHICSEGLRPCKVVATINSGCIAVATGGDQHHWFRHLQKGLRHTRFQSLGWAVRSEPSDALAAALANCNRANAGDLGNSDIGDNCGVDEGYTAGDGNLVCVDTRYGEDIRNLLRSAPRPGSGNRTVPR